MPKKLIITGSNRGTGYEIAKAFYGHDFEIASLNRTFVGEKWLGEIECDLTVPSQVEKACNQAIQQLGGIDVCVLNAAVRKLYSIEEMSNDDWEKSIATNFSSAFYVVKNILPELKKSKGYLVIMGSHSASHYFEKGAAYCSTKAALKAFNEVLIQEVRHYGIRSTIINAGAILNRPKYKDEYKMKPGQLAEFIYKLTITDSSILIGETEMRPGIIDTPPVTGIDRLLYI